MSDVFISYARSTASQAQGVAQALRDLGYVVWRDDELPAHRSYAEVIEERLAAAKAVVVIWSAEAVRSEWVQSEADRARQDRKLVQLSLDGAPLPMPFDRIQCADLSGWSGDATAPGWRKVAASIGELVGAAPAPAAAPATPAPKAAPEPLLAVLAFDNLSGDPETTYFSDGVSEEILQTVARGADLKVIGRGSSFQFRGADKAAANIAAQLHATHVLDGSVRRSGSRVRIAANLIECAQQTTLWSDRYDRDLSDVFALQDEIAEAVAAALKLMFARSGKAQPIDPEAYDLFLRTKAWGSGIDPALERIAILKRVVALSPGFARAWANLAGAVAFTLRRLGAEASRHGLTREQAIQAAETALALDPSMGAAYQALAMLEPFGAYQAREALDLKALAAAPNDPEVMAEVLGRRSTQFLSAVGRNREGLELARRAFELDPLHPQIVNGYGLLLTFDGRLAEAAAIFDAALAQWPRFGFLILNRLINAARLGDWRRVDELIPSTATLDAEAAPGAVRYVRNLRRPDAEELRLWVEEARGKVATTGTMSLNELRSLSDVGLMEEAFALADKASFAHMFDPAGPLPAGNSLVGAFFGTGNPMIYDPRFVALCARLGLCDYWVQTGQWPDCADATPYDFRAECRRLASHG